MRSLLTQVMWSQGLHPLLRSAKRVATWAAKPLLMLRNLHSNIVRIVQMLLLSSTDIKAQIKSQLVRVHSGMFHLKIKAQGSQDCANSRPIHAKSNSNHTARVLATARDLPSLRKTISKATWPRRPTLKSWIVYWRAPSKTTLWDSYQTSQVEAERREQLSLITQSWLRLLS